MLHVAHNVLIGIAALWVSTLLHEWAHALFARLVGFQVLSVAFGTGRPVFDRTFFRSMRFTVGAVPGVGLTTFGSPTPMAHHKLRLAVAFLAGPLSHLPVVLLL